MHRNRWDLVARVPAIASRARTAALVALLLLAGCAAPGLDEQQSDAARRTCASLRERVINRSALPFDDPGLEAALAEADFGPEDGPTPVSPATRLIEACRRLGEK